MSEAEVSEAEVSEAEVRFVATLAAVMHPVKMGRDGARVVLDVPLSEQVEVMKLSLLTEVAFEVTVRAIVQEEAPAKQPKVTIRRWDERK